MSLSLVLTCFWFVIANILAMTPSEDSHWRNAYVLIAVGIPLVGFVTAQHGPVLGLVVLAGGCSVLRWPVIYLTRWLRRGAASRPKEPAE